MEQELTVQSEIYSANVRRSDQTKGIVSEFSFDNPKCDKDNGDKKKLLFDKDGDLILKRKKSQSTITIEHHSRTNLQLVGLQVWRGALLLSDLMLDVTKVKPNSVILELGSGTGLSSIAASLWARNVICTDIDVGGLLDQIRRNISFNEDVIKCPISVIELDFFSYFYSDELREAFSKVNVIMAADVVYDDDLTDAFISTLDRIMPIPPKKTAYIALEKRFVFTIADLNTVAPCYEHFVHKITSSNKWKCEMIPLHDIPQYFHYVRLPQLVVWKLTGR